MSMETNKAERMNKMVAISVAIISTFLAVSKVKDDNIVQAMMQAKSDSVDAWNEYQSKKIKTHVAQNSLPMYEALMALVAEKGRSASKAHDKITAQHALLSVDIARYEKESNDLKAKAQGFQKAYDDLNLKDDEFDLSDACLSVSLMMLAVVALTSQTYLFWLAWALGGMGILFGVSGFSSWNLHPDWLVKLLT